MNAQSIAALSIAAGLGLTAFAATSSSAEAATVHLTQRQGANVVRIVHHLPTCVGDMVTGCKVREHRKTLASFSADRRTYFVVIRHGQVKHAEIYPR